jgi:hypothetical protein
MVESRWTEMPPSNDAHAPAPPTSNDAHAPAPPTSNDAHAPAPPTSSDAHAPAPHRNVTRYGDVHHFTWRTHPTGTKVATCKRYIPAREANKLLTPRVFPAIRASRRAPRGD